MKLHGHVPNSYIHVSMSDLYIPRISLLIWLQQNRQADPGNIWEYTCINRSQMYECGNWETEHYKKILVWKWQGRAVSFLEIHKSEPVLTGPLIAVYCVAQASFSWRGERHPLSAWDITRVCSGCLPFYSHLSWKQCQIRFSLFLFVKHQPRWIQKTTNLTLSFVYSYFFVFLL